MRHHIQPQNIHSLLQGVAGNGYFNHFRNSALLYLFAAVGNCLPFWRHQNHNPIAVPQRWELVRSGCNSRNNHHLLSCSQAVQQFGVNGVANKRRVRGVDRDAADEKQRKQSLLMIFANFKYRTNRN